MNRNRARDGSRASSAAWTAAAACVAIALGAQTATSPALAFGTATAPLPERLADAGFFAGRESSAPRPDLLSFTPQYPLWSDGATKRRWLELPRGQFIDAARPGAWEFPNGTRLWKEFAVDGRRVETRLIERLEDGSWRYATYVWNDDGTDAVLAPPEGIRALPVPGAPSGRYTILSEYDCRACHEGSSVPVLGFSALQLSPARDPLAAHAERPLPDDQDLRTLTERGALRNLPSALRETPPRIAASSALARAALGYLHGNCGHCHSVPDETGASVPVDAILAQDVAAPGGVQRVLRSLVGVASRFRPPGGLDDAKLVVPGDAASSVLAIRMRSRDPRVQMPPLGTDVPDTKGLALIERWIDHELQNNEEHDR